jgi:hypothetical protein
MIEGVITLSVSDAGLNRLLFEQLGPDGACEPVTIRNGQKQTLLYVAAAELLDVERCGDAMTWRLRVML